MDNKREVELSLVVPCYNEEKVLEKTIPPLAEIFAASDVSLQLVLVDNGSLDGTSQAIDRLIDRGLPVTKGHVPVNQGQGLGFVTGFQLAQGRYIGWINSDGQIDPKDVLATFQALKGTGIPALAKCARRSRRDGAIRKIVSIGYNLSMRVIFHGIPSFDINSNPKILPAEVLRNMELTSTDWFLEAETMLKARHLGLPVIEIVVQEKNRAGGRSHVRFSTILEFMSNILRYRFGGPWRSWCDRVTKGAYAPPRLYATQKRV